MKMLGEDKCVEFKQLHQLFTDLCFINLFALIYFQKLTYHIVSCQFNIDVISLFTR